MTKLPATCRKSLRDGRYALAAHLLIAQYQRRNKKLQEAAISYLEALREADMMIIKESQQAVLRQQYEPLIEEFSQEQDKEMLGQICDNVTEMLVRQNWRDHITKTRRQMSSGGSGGSSHADR